MSEARLHPTDGLVYSTAIATCVMLVVAIVPTMPYAYYSVLRVVVCAASLYLMRSAHLLEAADGSIGFAVLAILYNPIATVTMPRISWTVVNLITIYMLLGYATKHVRFRLDREKKLAMDKAVSASRAEDARRVRESYMGHEEAE